MAGLGCEGTQAGRIESESKYENGIVTWGEANGLHAD